MNRFRKGGKGFRRPRGSGGLLLCAFLMLAHAAVPASARDAAFLDPGSSGGVGSDDAIRVEPKNDVDIGDSNLGVARRVDLFFVNQSGLPVKIEKVDISGDGNVATEIASDDCSKQGTISPGSRCSVAVSVTPSSPGPWSAELLMTHDGAGRIVRARLSGKTAGTATGEKKDMGLALSTKEINPVNFGDVDIGNGKIVRSALMVNDSAEPITLYSIDVIEASNGLQRLDQGCAVDMELKPGESCPVTLVWTPGEPGQISTDLIIRHSGRLGFAVVPIRGTAKGFAADAAKSGNNASTGGRSGSGSSIPSPPSATDLQKAAGGKIAPVSASSLGNVSGSSAPPGRLTLIGTVGNRAVILQPDGKTVVASAGDSLDMGEKEAKVVQIRAKSAEILVDGKKITLSLESSPELIEKATAVASKTKDKDKDAVKLGASESTAASSSAPLTPVSASTAPSGGLPGGLSGGSMYGGAGSTVSGAPK